ncbi:MAG TPA: hypothetical protein VH234_04980 [Candidatus Saccharimonadales bacterium]|jgi:hypothetical protein|nr:hypothetical protein [Candidatus Saccharimonadales bacterium]
MVLSTHELLALVAATLGGGLGVTLVAHLFKNVFKLESSAVIHTLVVALSAVAAGAQYVQQIHSSIPPVVLGISGPAIYGFSQIIYRYTGYGTSFLGKVRAYNASIAQPSTTTASDAQVAAVNPPADAAGAEPAPAAF